MRNDNVDRQFDLFHSECIDTPGVIGRPHGILVVGGMLKVALVVVVAFKYPADAPDPNSTVVDDASIAKVINVLAQPPAIW